MSTTAKDTSTAQKVFAEDSDFDDISLGSSSSSESNSSQSEKKKSKKGNKDSKKSKESIFKDLPAKKKKDKFRIRIKVSAKSIEKEKKETTSRSKQSAGTVNCSENQALITKKKSKHQDPKNKNSKTKYLKRNSMHVSSEFYSKDNFEDF